MKAKNREQYVEAWRMHVRELIHPHMDANVPIEQYYETRDKLDALIEKAADQIFPEPKEFDLLDPTTHHVAYEKES